MSAAVACDPALHPHLREHPEDLHNLRPFPLLRADQGECPGCGTSINVAWSAERRAAEGVPTRRQDRVAELREQLAAEDRA